MVKEVLKLKTDNGLGADNPTFKDIEIEYSFKSPLMGIPTLTAELLWPTCLDDEWTSREYVELRGEKYYIRQVQTSEISNNNVIKYKHSLDFKSEREQLLHVYFYDVVPSWSATYDRPNSNSTKFTFFGTPREYCDRLNCAFRYAGIGDSILNTKTSLTDLDTPVGDGYCVVLSGYGDGDLEQSQEFRWEDQWLWDALSEGFNKYKIPFAFHGKKIVFNEYIEPIEHVFKYGFDNALLSIKKDNANARIINRITFKGSSENIPYHYPNETEYGHISLSALGNNSVLGIGDFVLERPNRLVGKIMSGQPITLNLRASADATLSNIMFDSGDGFEALSLGQWYRIEDFTSIDEYHGYTYRIYFSIAYEGDVVLSKISGQIWDSNTASPIYSTGGVYNLIGRDFLRITALTHTSSGADLVNNAEIESSHIVMHDLPSGTYALDVNISWVYDGAAYWWQIAQVTFENKNLREFFWQSGDNTTSDLLAWGIQFTGELTNAAVGDGIKWTSDEPMPFQGNLMPPKYRDTHGTERFYNALNNTYLKRDGKTYYVFKNPYIEGNPNEYIFTDETIKPTIEGVENSQSELFGVISGIAFDVDDNDSLKSDVGSDDKDKNDSANYVHSFFYIRLNKFDGPFGFDLFNSASQTDPMTIQMTSGKCNGCKFKIQVIESQDGDVEVWSNPVQTLGADGNIVVGSQSQIINKDNPQEWQQDTTKNYIWIAVQKDAETFGVIMPNRSHDYLPEVGDTFNIINIDLPQGYITAAEERGMYAMLDFMEDNNEEKFNFDITASRIFFAENPDILATLNENSRIKIEYDGKIYEQYVSEFAIDCKKNEVLPDVKLTLANTLEPSGSFVDEVVAKAVDSVNIGKGVGSAGGGGLTTALADRRYVRKDKDDRTEYKISSDTAFEVGEFVSGSSGGILFIDPETGQSTLEVDNFKARIKAIFETLEIAHVRSIGGKLTITPGGSINISFVEELDDAYRCYFKQQEGSESADCRFIVGDDVICQSWNVSSGSHQNAANKRYWRKVTAVSNSGAYVELSKSQCAHGSDIPEIGDTICQLGSDDVSRQSAIVLSTVDAFSPNITLYEGVTEFTLSGKEMVEMGVDKNTHRAYFHVYGNAYIGDKKGNSFIKYNNLLKLLEIKAKLQIGTTVGDQTLEEYIQQVSPPVEQEDIEQFVNNIVNPKIEGLQNQIDGAIETWFAEGVPELDNYPANTWDDNAKIAHLGDLYYDNETGAAYRFSMNEDGTFYWLVITDEAISKALAAAKAAQDTADGKRRVFTSQPKPPYDKGDLWVNATYPADTTAATRDPANGKYYNDILRCGSSRATGSFDISDWGLSSSYTDDSLAQEALQTIAGYEYLKNALLPENPTQIIGGLIMSTLISLGYTDGNGVRHAMAGMNGSWVSSLGGRTVGSWWGGPMVDLFDENDTKKNLAAGTYATSMVRMDGSAYFSDGNIGFRKDGSGWLGNDQTGIKFDTDGTMTFGSGVTINIKDEAGINYSLASLVNFNSGLTSLLKPVIINANGTIKELSWSQASQANAVRVKVGLYSDDFISSKGVGSSSGGSGGGGTVVNLLTAWSDYTTSMSTTRALSAGLGYDLYTRVGALENGGSLSALNLVQSGSGNAVTALSLSSDKKTLTVTKGSTFLTAAEADSKYVTLSTTQTITGNKTFNADIVWGEGKSISSASMQDRIVKTSGVTIHGGGDGAKESDANLRFGSWYSVGWYNTCADGQSSSFTQGDNAMWLNVRNGHLYVQGGYHIRGGSSSQFLKADGSVDSNTYLTESSASPIFVKKAGDTMSGDLMFYTDSFDTRQVRFSNSATDYGRIAVGAEAQNQGWMEIATADDGTEPIYARQYTGAFTTITRSATLLDENGNTAFPGKVAASYFTANTTSLCTNLNADLLDGLHLDSVRGYRVNHPSINAALSVGNVPFNAFGMQHGTPLFNDPEFWNGPNSVQSWAAADGRNVEMTRIQDDQSSANSSNYILQFKHTGGNSDHIGGFAQLYASRANAVFMQIFRAKIPVGYSLIASSHATGDGASHVWITSNQGTGKWEWYARVTYCGASGSFNQSGIVLLKGAIPSPTAPLYWYISHCQVWDLTKNNYGALRAKFTDALSTPRTIWGQSFDGTANVSGLLTATTGTSHSGIKLGNTYLTAIDGEAIFQNNTAIRFGPDAWNSAYWAGINYVHSTKTINIGVADGEIFTTTQGNEQTDGTVNLVNCSLKIGPITISYDAANNALKIDGAAYTTSWLSAKGVGGDTTS